MKKIILLLGLLSLGWLIYALFEPIFNNFSGWEQIPDEVYLQKFEGTQDEIYLAEIEQSKSLIDSIQKSSQSPSISIAAMINGKMVWTYAVGFQDIANRIKADTSTQYRIGSTSKALSSIGLGLLFQNGKLNPDSSIQYYTNRFKDKPKISIRQLASHQSGIRNYSSCLCFPIWEYYRNKHFNSIEESLNEFESDELLFEPGENFAYSSFNFTALSYAMDIVNPEGYLGFMQQKVCDAIKLNNTRPDDTNKTLESRSIPYEIYDNYFKRTIDVDLSHKWASGGFLSTPSDLVKVGNVLVSGNLLNEKTIKTITTPQQLNNGKINEQNYAMGWRHDYSNNYLDGEIEVEVIHHGGMAVGGTTLLLVFPEYQLVIALSTNKGDQQGNFKLFDYVVPIAELFITKLRISNSM
ncbi:serine hydrolase domain-containing protein [Ekhidna sp.]